MFEYRFIRFQYHNEKNIFEPIVFNSSLPYNMIHENLSGGTSMKSDNAHKNYHVQRIRYGVCDILIPIDPLPKLLLREVLNPFYLFQVRLDVTNGYRYSLSVGGTGNSTISSRLVSSSCHLCPSLSLFGIQLRT